MAHAHYTHPLTTEDLRLGGHVTDETTTNDTNMDTDHTEDEEEVDDDAMEVEDDDETLPPDEEELAEALANVAEPPSYLLGPVVVDLTLEEGATAANPIEL